MIFFTGIVFIAELIILYSIIVFIINTDKKVCALTEHIEKRRMILKWRMSALTEISQGINEVFPIIVKKFKKTRKNIIIRSINEMVQGTILLLFKPKYKKFLIGMKTGIGVVRKLLKV